MEVDRENKGVAQGPIDHCFRLWLQIWGILRIAVRKVAVQVFSVGVVPSSGLEGLTVGARTCKAIWVEGWKDVNIYRVQSYVMCCEQYQWYLQGRSHGHLFRKTRTDTAAL